jgi:hypothetical protein
VNFDGTWFDSYGQSDTTIGVATFDPSTADYR